MQQIDPARVGMSAQRLARIGPAMNGYVERGQLAGVSTLIARNGQIVHRHLCGQADMELGRPMADDTIFRIYSMTKPVTAVAALMLYEEGHFHLLDPIDRYIPRFADLQVFRCHGLAGPELEPLARPITFRDIFTHTSGLTYGWFEDNPVDALYRDANILAPDAPLSDLIDSLCELPLHSQPGSRWNYSISTDVLGYLIEQISGLSLDRFFKERIFEPLGMTSTAFSVSTDQTGRFSSVYTHEDDGRLEAMDKAKTSRFLRPAIGLSGGGGLVSTAEDFLRFAQMLLNRGELDGQSLLSRKTVELMTTDHLPSTLCPMQIGDSVLHGYGSGLGVSILTDLGEYGGLGSVGSYGWGGAANTNFWVDPSEDLIGILMTQYMPSDTFPVINDFRVLVYQALD